jgi:voltage-gated potassium channel
MGARAERMERRLERPVLVVAALVIPAIVLEVADISAAWNTVALALNGFIRLAFDAELIAMLTVADSRRGYLIHNPLSVAIVVLTPSFLPAVVQGMWALRPLRLARLLRLAPIFKLAFSLRGLQYASVFTGLVVLTGAAGYESAQPRKNYFDGIYWAVSTMTTAGSNEIPTTPEAKVLAMVLMIVGIVTSQSSQGPSPSAPLSAARTNRSKPSRPKLPTISAHGSTGSRCARAKSLPSLRHCGSRSR